MIVTLGGVYNQMSVDNEKMLDNIQCYHINTLAHHATLTCPPHDTSARRHIKEDIELTSKVDSIHKMCLQFRPNQPGSHPCTSLTWKLRSLTNPSNALGPKVHPRPEFFHPVQARSYSRRFSQSTAKRVRTPGRKANLQGSGNRSG
jgi:hypothetical protein